jgi:hypothetical protein
MGRSLSIVEDGTLSTLHKRHWYEPSMDGWLQEHFRPDYPGRWRMRLDFAESYGIPDLGEVLITVIGRDLSRLFGLLKCRSGVVYK